MTLCPYASTHRLVEEGPDLLRKDLSPAGLLSPRAVRPAFLEDARREPAVYRQVLAGLGVGPRCVESGTDWVLLERVAAPVLWEVGDLSVWVEVARWLAGLHARLLGADYRSVPLLEHGPDLYRAWRRRAARCGAPRPVLDAHRRATRILGALPPVVLHGDLYPSNLLVSAGPPLRVWPLDWELIGRGPAVLDLAAITSGNGWGEEERRAIVAGYTRAAGGLPGVGPGPEWEEALLAARLHLCVQWLGTPTGWVPPAAQAHDWRSEALRLAGQL